MALIQVSELLWIIIICPDQFVFFLLLWVTKVEILNPTIKNHIFFRCLEGPEIFCKVIGMGVGGPQMVEFDFTPYEKHI